MPDRFYLHNSLSLVYVVEDAEAVDAQLPLGQSVWPQDFVVPCFALRFVLQARIWSMIRLRSGLLYLLRSSTASGVYLISNMPRKPFYQATRAAKPNS